MRKSLVELRNTVHWEPAPQGATAPSYMDAEKKLTFHIYPQDNEKIHDAVPSVALCGFPLCPSCLTTTVPFNSLSGLPMNNMKKGRQKIYLSTSVCKYIRKPNYKGRWKATRICWGPTRLKIHIRNLYMHHFYSIAVIFILQLGK